MKILVTGAAGFIGFHTSMSLLKNGHQVFGIDNLNNYYDINLKKKRLSLLKKYNYFKFNDIDICENQDVSILFKNNKFDKIIHLAAQAGVQYSITNPEVYIKNNINGFFNIINFAALNKVPHFIYASSSSVYGSNINYPFLETHNCSSPLSIYAATKLSNEALSYSYSNIHGIKTTGLRFFTVFGPYGRPDMSPFIFAESIIQGKHINLFNNGKLKRDFTYIDDAVNAINLIVNDRDELVNKSRPLSKIYNIGSNKPVDLIFFIKLFEKYLQKKAVLKFKPLLIGDVPETYACIDELKKDYNFQPLTSIDEGVKKFIEWYRSYN